MKIGTITSLNTDSSVIAQPPFDLFLARVRSSSVVARCQVYAGPFSARQLSCSENGLGALSLSTLFAICCGWLRLLGLVEGQTGWAKNGAADVTFFCV
jgi:hypothetical protein